MMSAENVENVLAQWQGRIEQQLAAALPSTQSVPPVLHQAMHYALTGGGKRIRPLLVYASGYLFEAEENALDACATAVELIHAYSLVHDDLPAMDDDDLRRGRPATHIAFGEATAILAGDALQARAFELIAQNVHTPDIALACLQTLSCAAGAAGMCGGQALDIHATGHSQTLAELEQMHRLKTGALIRAAVRMGALCGHANTDELNQLDIFADALGLAFQIQDDILDIEANAQQLGKTVGKDAAQHKSTFPALLGLETSKQQLKQLTTTLHTSLTTLGPRSAALAKLSELVIQRDH